MFIGAEQAFIAADYNAVSNNHYINKFMELMKNHIKYCSLLWPVLGV